MKQTWMVIFMVGCVSWPLLAAGEEGAPLSLVPQPAKVQREQGVFELNAEAGVVVDDGDAEARDAGQQFVERLKQGTGMDVRIKKQSGGRAIALTRKDANPALGPEGYTLTVKPDGVVISAAQGAGLFYGMQTFLQLLPPDVFSTIKVVEARSLAVPAVRIEDEPRFSWRGLLMDSSRHFFTKQEVKNFLDVMAQQKLNTLHWHLTDCVGWRLEIRKYPKLTEVGAWRDGIEFGLDPKSSTAYGPDGRYGGFYTQDDIREIVAYAQQRHITIVPEIEMPGHSGAVLRAYPQLACETNANVFCAGNDEAFAFLQDVLTEVMELFPSQFIHIGGDEVFKGFWAKCPKCQARKYAEGLKSEHELQSYFIRRMEQFINSKGRRMVGWSEIREGGIAANAVLTDWIGGGAESAREGHDVVMTPQPFCYLDHYQATSGEPKAWGGCTPLSKVYSLEPVPAGLTADEAKHILGAQGNLWAEYIPNYRHLQYMTYPRACALAEVTWTEKSLKDWADFRQRLETHVQRLTAQGVNLRRLDKMIANLSLNRPATASSVELPQFSPSNAVDGDVSTYWSSKYQDDAWLAVDLGAIKKFSGINIVWEAAYAKAFAVQTSTDGQAWTEIYKTSDGKGGNTEIRLASTEARHVHIVCTQRGTQWGNAIRELEVLP
jgi:hexosaminidase